MSSNYHVPIVNNDPRKNDAAIWNDPLGELDAAVANAQNRVSTIIAQSGTSSTEVVDSRNGYTVLSETLGDKYFSTKVLLVDANFQGLTAAKRFKTISAALAACVGGETVLIAPGIYTENVTIPANGVKLVGSGMPRYDGTSGRLVDGTIIRGHLHCGSKIGVVVRDLGVDQAGTASTNAITASNLTDNAPLHQVFRNVAILGNGSNSGAGGTAHGIECNGGSGCVFDNIKIWFCTHGLALLGSYNSAGNIYAYGCGGGSSVIVKSKPTSGSAERINIADVVIDGDPGDTYTRGGPVIVQAADDTFVTRHVNITNVTARHCVNGVVQVSKIAPATAANLTDIAFTNVSSSQNQDLALVGDYRIQTGTRLRFVNCASVARVAGYGWKIDAAGDAGIVELVGCSGDSSGSGDYSGTFAYVDINGAAWPSSGLTLAPQVDFRGEMLSGVTPAAAISVTAANTPVCRLSNPAGSTNDYAGLVLVWVRNSTNSLANSALWTITVMKGNHGGGAGVFAAELSQLGPNGIGASAPNFTFAVDGTNNHLEATPTDSASGNFYFSFAALGNIKVAAL